MIRKRIWGRDFSKTSLTFRVRSEPKGYVRFIGLRTCIMAFLRHTRAWCVWNRHRSLSCLITVRASSTVCTSSVLSSLLGCVCGSLTGADVDSTTMTATGGGASSPSTDGGISSPPTTPILKLSISPVSWLRLLLRRRGDVFFSCSKAPDGHVWPLKCSPIPCNHTFVAHKKQNGPSALGSKCIGERPVL